MERIETSYRLTEKEFARRLKLAGIPTSGAWRAYGLVTLTLIPSIIIFSIVGATNSALAFQAMLAFMILATVSAYWWKTGFPKRFEERLILDEDQLTHHWGNSRTEWSWQKIDQIEENSRDILFYSWNRPLSVPKRAFFGQLVWLQHWIDRHRDPNVSFETSAIQMERDRNDIHRGGPGYIYRILDSDLNLALQDRYQRISAPFWKLARKEAHGRSSNLKMESVLLAIAVGLAVLIVSMIALLSWSEDAAFYIRAIQRRLSQNTLPVVALGWVFPVVLLWLLWKMRSLMRIQAVKQRLSDEDATLSISPQGWMIVNRSNGTFGSWQDMTDLIYSQHFFGFKMINQLAYLIPKRIFESPAAADRFLQSIIAYCSQREPMFTDSAESPVPPRIEFIETQNPFQSPQQ